MKMSRFMIVLAVSLLLGVLSCSGGGPKFVIKATNAEKVTFLEHIINLIPVQKLYALDMGGNVIITDFQVSVENIKFELVGEDPAGVEIFFNGPFQVDLLNGDSVLEQTIGDLSIAPGTYSKLRMVLHKSTELDPAHVLYDRSVYIAGTISGVPFVMWHDTSENFDIEPAGGFIINEGEDQDLKVDFKLASLLDGIDLTGAADGDGDGTIEIDPDDSDNSNGNDVYADSLKTNVKAIADIIKE